MKQSAKILAYWWRWLWTIRSRTENVFVCMGLLVRGTIENIYLNGPIFCSAVVCVLTLQKTRSFDDLIRAEPSKTMEFDDRTIDREVLYFKLMQAVTVWLMAVEQLWVHLVHFSKVKWSMRYLYSVFLRRKQSRSATEWHVLTGSHRFLLATHTTILTLLRKHSPDGTTRTRRHTFDIAYYSIIDLGRMKGWVGLVGWPIADDPHKWSPVSCRSSAGQESSPVKDQRSNHCATQPTIFQYVPHMKISTNNLTETEKKISTT